MNKDLLSPPVGRHPVPVRLATAHPTWRPVPGVLLQSALAPRPPLPSLRQNSSPLLLGLSRSPLRRETRQQIASPARGSPPWRVFANALPLLALESCAAMRFGRFPEVSARDFFATADCLRPS